MLWCVKYHSGEFEGFPGPDGNVLVLFTTRHLADTWILESCLEQHLSCALRNDEELLKAFGAASEDFTFYVVNPPANPGGEIDGGIIEDVLKLKESA